MAECSYARCVQQRRNIRRDLQRWTKNMVHIVGLERIAEELMGRRKWKLYQESMSRSYLQPLNNNIKRTNPLIEEGEEEEECQKDIKQQQVIVNNSVANNAVEKTAHGDGKEQEGREGDRDQKENAKDTLDDRLKDWTPLAKCYFCVDGKLDSEHTTHGGLSPHQTDSDSLDSHSDGEVPTSLTTTSRGFINNNHHNLRPSLQHSGTPPNAAMTTIESMALAVAALSGAAAAPNGPAPALPAHPHIPAAAAAAFYGPAANVLTHNWYLANVARSFQAAAAAAAASSSDAEKGGGTDRGGVPTSVGGEQPLDLSKGATSNNSTLPEQKTPQLNNSVRLPTIDTKHIFNSDFRAKPRMSAVAGRRTYTEDELQAALRDIQSGKLGTRRAAVIYGIPRSTLRNKVYKLALERERESHLNTPLKLEEEEAMDDDKELSGAEEEKEVEKALEAPLLSMADLFRFTGRDHTPEALRHLLQKGKDSNQDPWSGLDHSEVGPYIQNLLLTSQTLLAGQKPPDSTMVNHMIPEFVKRMMEQEQSLRMNNNGDSDKLIRPSPSNSVITRVEKARSESDMETDDSPSNVILKIPSFRPTSSKNGCDIFRNMVESSGSMVSPPVTSESSSPPILPASSKPPTLVIKDVKDVIAQSISQKFQQTMAAAVAAEQQPNVRRPLDGIDFKRGGFTPPLAAPGMSVIKAAQELGGGRPSYQQPQQQHHHHQQQSKPLQQGSGGTTGGKGTRPKRGKYRNYDRDSLVEAVRAVQRGEMSVHRAGSYYGVPHSTLEYKVKERHLMRPRKRDPKPNPVDEKIASLKQNDIRIAQDKLKPAMKPPQKFPPTSPNGMKLPIFEPGMTPLAGYNPPPFPFWPHPGFTHIPLDYARNPTSPFPAPNPEFFASQMMQKLQEESSRTMGNSAQSAPTTTTAPALAKNARQMAESLLESASGSNGGSFLDGIIRSSLESGVPAGGGAAAVIRDEEDEERHLAPENMSNKALLDQLCRNSRLTPLSKAEGGGGSSGDESGRRESGSPLNFATGLSSQDNNDEDSSSQQYNKDGGSDVHTIELSNDSNASSSDNRRPITSTNPTTEEDLRGPGNSNASKQPRIYLKQDLVKPENLKPEMLVRFREVLVDNNGTGESPRSSSASENEAPQD